jgi:hypothetical protein
VDDVLVRFGVVLLVVNGPAEGFEERVEEFAADLGFVVVGRFVGFAVAVEALDEVEDWWWLRHLTGKCFCRLGEFKIFVGREGGVKRDAE